MDKPSQTRIGELQNAITALETQRSMLGDLVVDSSIAALRKELAAYQPSFVEERKLVTCIFCDVVDSSGMASDRDPEEVLQIIDGALTEMRLAVEEFGGRVSRFMGDGMLAVFGAPQAQEGHAEQAVRAGLTIQTRMAAYEVKMREAHNLPEFKVRVGINSGRVVGGGLAGSPGEYTVIGDTVNMAARFEAAAPPGGVLVGESTFHLAGGEGAFEVKIWAPIVIKGSPQPVKVYQVLHPITGLGRHAVRSAPMMGRAAELTTLQNAYRRTVSQDRPHVVEVIGPAGIGKTRLRVEFSAWLAQEHPGTQVWLGRAHTYAISAPYTLVRNALNDALKIGDQDTLEDRRLKLENAWRDASELTLEHLHGLAAILAIDYDDNLLEGLEVQARREVIFESFTRFCERQAEKTGLVLLTEDTHWADELSLDLLDELVKTLVEKPFLLVIFRRPAREPGAYRLEFCRSLSEDAYIEMSLTELEGDQVVRLVHGLLGSQNVPDALTAAIAEKAQGNPFFIEEILNTLIDEGALARRNGGWGLERDLAYIRVPDTVQGVLAARIDRLDPVEKHVIQHAAIVGRSFWQQLLGEIIQQDIAPQLEALSQRGFVTRLGRAQMLEDWEWIFRHVLVQDVAYESVLKEVRRDVHRRIAEWLEMHGSERLDELAPSLAWHFERGEVWDKAVLYLSLAAERASNVFAMREALNFYDRAIELENNHPGKIDEHVHLELHERRGDARGLIYEFEGAESDLQFVLSESRKMGDTARELGLLIRLGYLYRTADRLAEAVAHLEAALEVARASGDQHSIADTLYHLGTVAWTEGDNDRALRYQGEAVEICRALGLKDIVAVQALHGLAEATEWSGNPLQATEYYLESIALARLIGDKSYESENLYMFGTSCDGWMGIADYDRAIESCETALKISREARMDGHTAPAMLTLGSVLGRAGDYQRGLELLNEAILWGERLEVARFQIAAYTNLGLLLQDLNLFEMSMKLHTRTLKMARDTGVGYFSSSLQAGLAIDRLHKGDLNVESDLKDALMRAEKRRHGTHSVRCLQGLVGWALASRLYASALGYADELERKSRAGGLRERVAQAQRLRGEALLGLRDFNGAEAQLLQAEELANALRGVRLKWDVHASLAKLYNGWGMTDKAARHESVVREIVGCIRENIQDKKYKAGLPVWK